MWVELWGNQVAYTAEVENCIARIVINSSYGEPADDIIQKLTIAKIIKRDSDYGLQIFKWSCTSLSLKYFSRNSTRDTVYLGTSEADL